ncbi:MAG: hypothetical protein H7Y08_09635, partial [Rhizobiaceae bacterium]|nr:hypothetical protein [Rhizobiaceae bacterium]
NNAEAAAGRSEFTVSTTTPGTTTTLIFTTAATGSLSNPAVFNLRDITVKDADGLAKNVAGGDLLTGFTESTAATFTTAAPIVFTGIAATDKVAFDLTIDGASVKTTVVAGNGTGSANIANLVNSLNSDATFASVATASIGATNELVITSGTTGTSSGAVINSVGFFDSTGTVKTLATASAFSNVQAAATTTGTSFIDVTLDEDDNIVFDINVNGVGTKTVKIDRDLVNETLDITTGYIDTIANYKLVLDAALTNAGVVGVTTTAGSTAITFSTTSTSGTDATIVVTDLVASKGGNQLSVDAIDISDDGLAAVGVTTGDQVKAVLTAYISLVNTAITSVTEAASNLGSVASRIELQSSFVDTIIDTIEEGVSNLIDADLSEESTRLQALQTKQQLGIQALSIANASTQNVLALFQ